MGRNHHLVFKWSGMQVVKAASPSNLYRKVSWGPNPLHSTNIEVVLHGEKKVSTDNLKNTDSMRV